MNDLVKIFVNLQFQRLWMTGTSSGIARWVEVMCFSVFALQITKDATIAGYLMTLRLTGVLIASVLFLFGEMFRSVSNDYHASVFGAICGFGFYLARI